LYLNTTLNSVLNGLGKTSITFFCGILGLFLRIGFLFFAVPKIGIQGYLYGLLANQLFTTFFGSYCIYHILSSEDPAKNCKQKNQVS
jgi:stage V sporulation protein B